VAFGERGNEIEMTAAVHSPSDTAVMPEYTPFKGRYREAAVRMELSRVLWTMRSAVGKEITAAIFEVITGRELRVSLGDELLESRLSRGGDAVVESRAGEIRARLATRGWSG
jgi:hypothetical protein